MRVLHRYADTYDTLRHLRHITTHYDTTYDTYDTYDTLRHVTTRYDTYDTSWF